MNCNDMLSPWKAPALNPKEADFRGKAKDFLAGLFAVWASTATSKFNSVASISGSFWYDGFVEWLKNQELHAERYFLSFGNKEVKAKNERLANVGACTEATLQIIQDKNKEVTFVTDEGNHFEFFRERLEKALEYFA